MHLILDGSVLPSLFILAITVWACGTYVVAIGSEAKTTFARWCVTIIAAFALILATVLTVMALFRL